MHPNPQTNHTLRNACFDSALGDVLTADATSMRGRKRKAKCSRVEEPKNEKLTNEEGKNKKKQMAKLDQGTSIYETGQTRYWLLIFAIEKIAIAGVPKSLYPSAFSVADSWMTSVNNKGIVKL